ncbi:MAG: RusA family crossover junction endodeoxyribonuclease [Candidatus Nanoarchaeia archaeon]|nr:RusA family crossover junction endodeoxyribonuclease [Candidatus Nanoarchaeia archaeon]
MINFTIPGNPKALKRHRNFTRGSFHGNYDPSANDKRTFLDLSFNYRPDTPIIEPIKLQIEFYFDRPKSHFGTGKNKDIVKESAPIFHTTKPDTSNLIKFIEDAFNGVFWKDDSLICELHCRKYYSNKPRTVIIITILKNIPFVTE